MTLEFAKYEGTGNDFILIRNPSAESLFSEAWVSQVCHRRYGIGADGLIVLAEASGFDFEMIYFNADGKRASMCGNGGRCAVMFARELGIISQSAKFKAFDGGHQAEITGSDTVKLSMAPVHLVQVEESSYVLDTGSPHLVRFVTDLENLDVQEAGSRIRYNPRFAPGGINANFAAAEGEKCSMRTYERGVESETLSCGTGTIAVAIACSLRDQEPDGEYMRIIESPGGILKVYYRKIFERFDRIFLEGPARFVFSGSVVC